MDRIGLALFLITVMFTGRVVIVLRATWRGQGMILKVKVHTKQKDRESRFDWFRLLLGVCGIYIHVICITLTSCPYLRVI
jgi:hypothetical protein